ncbi:hypothetical protein BZA77DRAFT_301928 [Pyronema omphalodes]|nr:hypothetical protein BZA77DRAFT_301928 [Pyronema omphalodes]
MFPQSSGQQMDLQFLWNQVQELSAILAANRESTVGLVKRADEIRSRGGDPTADLNAINGDASIPTSRELELQEEVKALREKVEDLETSNDDLQMLAQDYEVVLESMLKGLRVYAHEHSIATINIHGAYTNQLAAERATNAQLRQREIENSARLSKLSTLIREAYQQETVLEPDIVIERLKAENAALRAALGVEDEEKDDD